MFAVKSDQTSPEAMKMRRGTCLGLIASHVERGVWELRPVDHGGQVREAGISNRL